MSKNKDRKKDKKLRQSIEVLKAQLKDNIQIEIKTDTSATKTTVKAKTSDAKANLEKIKLIEDKYIKQDLIKTIILSAGAFAAIIILWVLNITSF